MTKSDNAAEIGLHVFERAGLGKAPFRCVGMVEKVYQACQGAPVQPGGSCDYCGNGIRYCFQVKGADGKLFEVGSDCVMRTGDAGLIRSYKTSPALRKLNREKRALKDEANKAEWAKIMADEAIRAKLAACSIERSGKDESWLAFAERAWSWCGAAGRARYVKEAKLLLKGRPT